eukprot:TRINITY_DN922_c0_g1_i2.p1 TRINITY_DN922_c0_g1~~TRINITY_DN922_c0_g1_i2.p1  ORF type:complete len:357 (-),score=89.18 TRINITY_DN922_c0_g1_i2:1275-2345(-)
MKTTLEEKAILGCFSKLEEIERELENNITVNMMISTYFETIDEICLELCFEMHKKHKIEMEKPHLEPFYSEPIQQQGLDIFGQGPSELQNSETFECVNCKRIVVGSRFAPHLEKCMGMGRNSSRIASQRLATVAEKTKIKSEMVDPDELSLEPDVDTDDCDEQDYLEEPVIKKEKQPKQKKTKIASPAQVAQKSVQEQHYEKMREIRSTFGSIDNLERFLVSTCGVLCATTNKLCTRTLKCPIHTDEHRQQARLDLLSRDSCDFDSSSRPISVLPTSTTVVTLTEAMKKTKAPLVKPTRIAIKADVSVSKSKNAKFTTEEVESSLPVVVDIDGLDDFDNNIYNFVPNPPTSSDFFS